MSIQIIGAAGNIAKVDSNNNLNVVLPTTQTQSGFAAINAENDPGTLYGSRIMKAASISEDRRLQVGLDTPMFNHTFNYTAQDTGIAKYVTATMTNTWNTSGMLLNANSTATATTGTCWSTYRHFGLIGNGGLDFFTTVNKTAAFLAAQVFEAGLFPFTAGTAAPTEGVFFRWTSAGLIGVLNFNGVETTTSVLATDASFSTDTCYLLGIKVTERNVYFLRDGIVMANGVIAIPAANGQPFITTALPVSYQFRNSGTVSGSPQAQIKITDFWVNQKDIALGMSLAEQQALQALSAYRGLSGGTMGSTALYSNSLAPGAGAVMTNTTAALGSGLGGQFSALPTLAANTDGIVCSYQNPAGSVNQTPRTLIIKGVRVQGAVTTVLAGNATPVIYAYSVAYGHTAVSLATAEAVAAKAPTRVPLGYESYAAAAALGTLGQGVTVDFKTPLVVNPGEFIALVAKNVGVVTTTGVITFLVNFTGYTI